VPRHTVRKTSCPQKLRDLHLFGASNSRAVMKNKKPLVHTQSDDELLASSSSSTTVAGGSAGGPGGSAATLALEVLVPVLALEERFCRSRCAGRRKGRMALLICVSLAFQYDRRWTSIRKSSACKARSIGASWKKAFKMIRILASMSLAWNSISKRRKAACEGARSRLIFLS